MNRSAADSPENDQNRYWDEIWRATDLGYQENNIWSIIDARKVNLLLPLLPSAGRVLEVGCGSAALSACLARRGYQVWCLDRSRFALDVAGRRFSLNGLRATCIRGDALALPFGAEAFDVVLSTGLLEHFFDPSTVVTEMVRVLRPGGVFYSDIVPKKWSTLRAFDFLRRKGRHCFYERSFSRSDIIMLLRNAGLSGVSVFSAGVFPPLLPVVNRYHIGRRFQTRLAELMRPISFWLDRSWLAERWGFYYFACGHRPEITL